jgi:hypothetical protein
MMDNEYRLDYAEILKTVRGAEVVLFRFVTLPQRLLIDNRTSATDGPLLKIVPRAKDAEDRFRSLKVLRPRFHLPQKISAVWWPRNVDRLADDGIWDAVVKRLASADHDLVSGDPQAILSELRQLERAELANAIGGEGYRTLWPARSTP